MQLPHSRTQAVYIEQIKAVEAKLKEATSGEENHTLLLEVQKRLDLLAEKYQNSDELGTARYKLYELQALVHYFSGDDDDALDFINQAIETRGDSYPRAEKLKSQLLTKTHTSKNADLNSMTKQERRKKLIGLEGWLAFFVVGVSLGILLGIINLFGYPSVFNDLASVQSQAPEFVAAMMPALWFEILTNIASIALAVWLIVLLAQHKKSAKTVAIIYLVSTPLLFIVDYAWVSSIFDSFNLGSDAQRELSSAAGDSGRSIIGAFIWAPYFLVSKRVKRTLTK